MGRKSDIERGMDNARGEKAYHDAIEGTRAAAPLGVPERRDARVQAEAVGEHVLDVLGVDGLELGVLCALGDDHDRLALAHLAVLRSGRQMGSGQRLVLAAYRSGDRG